MNGDGNGVMVGTGAIFYRTASSFVDGGGGMI